MAPIQNVSRRSFLATLGISGGGLVVGFALSRGTAEAAGAVHTTTVRVVDSRITDLDPPASVAS